MMNFMYFNTVIETCIKVYFNMSIKITQAKVCGSNDYAFM